MYSAWYVGYGLIQTVNEWTNKSMSVVCQASLRCLCAMLCSKPEYCREQWLSESCWQCVSTLSRYATMKYRYLITFLKCIFFVNEFLLNVPWVLG